MAYLKVGRVKGRLYARIVECTRGREGSKTQTLLWVGYITEDQAATLRTILIPRVRSRRRAGFRRTNHTGESAPVSAPETGRLLPQGGAQEMRDLESVAPSSGEHSTVNSAD